MSGVGNSHAVPRFRLSVAKSLFVTRKKKHNSQMHTKSNVCPAPTCRGKMCHNRRQAHDCPSTSKAQCDVWGCHKLALALPQPNNAKRERREENKNANPSMRPTMPARLAPVSRPRRVSHSPPLAHHNLIRGKGGWCISKTQASTGACPDRPLL